jgi:hypothetical protein
VEGNQGKRQANLDGGGDRRQQKCNGFVRKFVASGASVKVFWKFFHCDATPK